MKTTLLAFCWLASGLSAAPPPDVAPPPRLYLHLLTPTQYDGSGGSTPPKRIVSVEVYPSQDLIVAVGADASTLRGRIEPRGNSFHAHLEGTSAPSTGIFDGDIDLEKLVAPGWYVLSGGICRVVFVLSTRQDCEAFLIQQAASDEEMVHRSTPK